MTLLALDLGTTTGWATRTSAQTVAHGWINLKGGRYEGGGMRFLRFSRWLDDLQLETDVSEVVFEEVRRHMGVDAAHVYGGMLATLTAWCEQRNVPYRGIPVGTIKKFGCGRGNGDKQAMIDAARALGYPATDDNEADAIHLLRYCLSMTSE